MFAKTATMSWQCNMRQIICEKNVAPLPSSHIFRNTGIYNVLILHIVSFYHGYDDTVIIFFLTLFIIYFEEIESFLSLKFIMSPVVELTFDLWQQT